MPFSNTSTRPNCPTVSLLTRRIQLEFGGNVTKGSGGGKTQKCEYCD